MPCQGAVAFIGIAVKADVLEREVLERCEQRCTHTLQVSIAVNNRSRPPSGRRCYWMSVPGSRKLLNRAPGKGQHLVARQSQGRP